MFKKVLFALFLFSSLPVMAMNPPGGGPEVAEARARLAALRVEEEREAERAAREATRAATEGGPGVRSSIGHRDPDFDGYNASWD